MFNNGLHIFIFLVMGLLCLQNITAQKEELSIEAYEIFIKKPIDYYVKQGDSLKGLYEYKKASNFYQQAYQLSITKGDTLSRNNAGFKYGALLINNLNEFDRGNAVIKELYQFNCEEENTRNIIRSLMYEGTIWYYMQKNQKALYQFTEIINLLEKEDDNYLKWYSHFFRGNLLIRLDVKDKVSRTKYDFNEAISYLSSENAPEDRFLTYTGSIWTEKNPAKRSALYLDLIDKYCSQSNKNKYCYYPYLGLASSFLADNEPEKALQILTGKEILQGKRLEDVSFMIERHFDVLGRSYLALNNYVMAEPNLKKAQKLYKEGRVWIQLMGVTEQLAIIYKNQGNLVKSNLELQKISDYLQSMHNEQLDKQLTDIKNVHLLEDKQREKVNIVQENKDIIHRKNKAGAIIQFLIWVLGIFVVFIISWCVYEKLKLHRLNEKINHNRLRSLQINMNPHFLFNSFSTLQNYILKKEKKKAIDYMKDLSGLINNIFYSSDTIYINFVDEINILKTYVSLERGRFYNDFEVFWDIAPMLEKTNPMIPSMMIQPHIENAIIHGFSHSEKTKQLYISFSLKSNTHVFIKIKDNGVGRLAAAKIKEQSGATVKSLSIATKNIQERMDIMKDSRIGAGSVTVFDLTDQLRDIQGTEVHLMLPIIDQKKSIEFYSEAYNHG